MRARPTTPPRLAIGPAVAITLGIAFLAASAIIARADEQAIPMKDGAGLAETTANCSGCHSLDYVRMNAPFLSPDTWKAEVTKMRTVFGAQIDDVDSARIVAYLAANYGPSP
jgi:mono/diheme cytochrome c family protein